MSGLKKVNWRNLENVLLWFGIFTVGQVIFYALCTLVFAAVFALIRRDSLHDTWMTEFFGLSAVLVSVISPFSILMFGEAIKRAPLRKGPELLALNLLGTVLGGLASAMLGVILLAAFWASVMGVESIAALETFRQVFGWFALVLYYSLVAALWFTYHDRVMTVRQYIQELWQTIRFWWENL